MCAGFKWKVWGLAQGCRQIGESLRENDSQGKEGRVMITFEICFDRFFLLIFFSLMRFFLLYFFVFLSFYTNESCHNLGSE